MSLAGKIFAVISLVVAVFYTGITAALFSFQENYKQKLVDTTAAHEDAIKAKNDDIITMTNTYRGLEAAHNRVKDERSRLLGENGELRSEWKTAAAINKYAMAVIDDQEAQIAALNNRVDRYRDDVLAKDGDNKKLLARIDDIEGKNTDLLKDRDKLNDLLTVKVTELTNAVKEVEKLTNDLSDSSTMLAKLKDQYPDIYRDLLQGTLVREASKVIRGKVTGVDKDLGLVIINVGQRNDVVKGYSFIVFRGDQYIGKIVVDEVFPDMAATHYDRDSMKGHVEVGDDVTTKLVIEL